MNLKKESLLLHEKNKGKISVVSKIKIQNNYDLSLAYSPGVAEPCLKIKDNPSDVYKYTSKGNMIAIVTDGSAVLGLGNIGPEASLPVMEGKAILFKEFGNVDAFPICLNTQDPDEIINIVKNISPSFGGINLEDIAAPKCVYIERRLKKELNIPVFHDDQHGTAIVLSAALINSCRLTGKKISELTYVLSGTGAAGSSIAKMLKKLGVTNLYAFNKNGVLTKNNYKDYNFLEKELIDQSVIAEPLPNELSSLKELIKGKDVFIGVSAPNILTTNMVKSMSKDPFVFALANPDPEISYEDAVSANAYIIGTGRSDYPNQINNVLAFPGLFRGALDAHSKNITENMKLAASIAIASIIKDDELTREYIIPSPFDKRVSKAVSKAVCDETLKTK
ncbi:MAG: malic enzyme-like NAD(P)-binding protein [Candidatus Izemoplasma sp.]